MTNEKFGLESERGELQEVFLLLRNAFHQNLKPDWQNVSVVSESNSLLQILVTLCSFGLQEADPARDQGPRCFQR